MDKPLCCQETGGQNEIGLPSNTSITLPPLDHYDVSGIYSGKTKLPPRKLILSQHSQTASENFKDGWISVFIEVDVFEDVTQDAHRSLAILSQCFSILARWRGHCRRGRD